MTRFEVISFEESHVSGVSVCAAQARHQDMLDDPAIWTGGWSGFYDGELIVIGNSAVAGDGTLSGGLLFTDKITPRRFLAVHHFLMRLIGAYEAEGLKMFVHIDPDYPQAKRWASLMDFWPAGIEDIQERRVLRFER